MVFCLFRLCSSIHSHQNLHKLLLSIPTKFWPMQDHNANKNWHAILFKNKYMQATVYIQYLQMSEGIKEVILYPSLENKRENRGFAFIIYEDHHRAARARRMLLNNELKLWGHKLTVDWADPEPFVDREIMEKV